MSEPSFAGIEDEQRFSGDQRAFLDEARRMLDHSGRADGPALRTWTRPGVTGVGVQTG